MPFPFAVAHQKVSQSWWWCGWCLIEGPTKSKGFRAGVWNIHTYYGSGREKMSWQFCEGGLAFHGPFHRHWATNVLCIIFITNNFITHFTYLQFTIPNFRYRIFPPTVAIDCDSMWALEIATH